MLTINWDMLYFLYNMKRYYKSLLNIAIPVSLQSLIQASLNMIDQFMIGKLGEGAIASVGIGSKGLFILLFVIAGIGGGASIFIAQYWGKKEKDKIGRVLGITLLSGSFVTIIFFIISFVFPQQFISVFTKDVEILTFGTEYLKIISLGYFPMLLVVAWSSALRSTGHTKLPLYAGLISVFLNTALNYILIFGFASIPAMGIKGAAIATSLARLIEAAIIIIYAYWKKLPGSVSIRELLHIPRTFAKAFAITSIPLVLTEFIWVLGDTMFSVIYGRIGTEELAAMTITGPVQMLTIGLLTGLSTAAAVILGNELGADNKETASVYAKRFIFTGILLTALLGLMVIALSRFYVSLFNVSPSVRESAVNILMIFGIILWVKVSNMIMGNGILRSGGDTRFVLMMDTFGMWAIGVPAGFIAAFVLKLPFPLVYLIVTMEEFVRMILMYKRTRSGKWLNNLVEEL